MKPETKKILATDFAPLTLTLKATCLMHPDATEGHLHFGIQDCVATVTEDGKEIGTVEGTIGGAMDLKDEATGMLFSISPREFWTEFQKQIRKHPEYERLRKRREANKKPA